MDLLSKWLNILPNIALSVNKQAECQIFGSYCQLQTLQANFLFMETTVLWFYHPVAVESGFSLNLFQKQLKSAFLFSVVIRQVEQKWLV